MDTIPQDFQIKLLLSRGRTTLQQCEHFETQLQDLQKKVIFMGCKLSSITSFIEDCCIALESTEEEL